MSGKLVDSLTCPDLVHMFMKVCKGAVLLGRDARLLRQFTEDENLSRCQVLLGFYLYGVLANTKDIPSFLRAKGRWLVSDKLQAKAELCTFLRPGIRPPTFERAGYRCLDGNSARDVFFSWPSRPFC